MLRTLISWRSALATRQIAELTRPPVAMPWAARRQWPHPRTFSPVAKGDNSESPSNLSKATRQGKEMLSLSMPSSSSSLPSSSLSSSHLSNKKKNINLKEVNMALEQITGVNEIAALKQAVTNASDRLQASTQNLQVLRHRLDDETIIYQELSAKYNEMLTRRHEWTNDDVKAFAQLTADEGRARSAVDATRQSLKYAEDEWQQAQTLYMDAVRQRYHEEQVWQDKWRVLGTYWTWALIGLNSVVFIAGQIFHYRRETTRMNALHDMIRPLSVAAQLENEARMQTVAVDKKAVASDKEEDSNAYGKESAQLDNNQAENQKEIWMDFFQQWKQSSLKLCQHTGRLVRAQLTSMATSCSQTTKQIVWQPTVHIAKEVSTIVSNLDKENNFHWPSAIIGATGAAVAFLCLAMFRGPRQ